MLPNKTINNLTTDWNDGILIASLVDAHAPGLCTEMDTMDHENALENATLAMKLAEEWLDVPQVSYAVAYAWHEVQTVQVMFMIGTCKHVHSTKTNKVLAAQAENVNPPNSTKVFFAPRYLPNRPILECSEVAHGCTCVLNIIHMCVCTLVECTQLLVFMSGMVWYG